MANGEQAPHVNRELAFDQEIARGARGMRAKRVQEWLNFHDFGTIVDSDFGAATERCVQDFQRVKGLQDTGRVDEETWEALVTPLNRALAPLSPTSRDSVSSLTLKYARQHLAEHPIELGGDNRGPWVRVYMSGNDGPEWRWCAGFVTFVMRQACKTLDLPMPIQGSFSCDSLAFQARNAGLFVRGGDIGNGAPAWDALGDSQIFLVRRTSTDWVHTGLSFSGEGSTFSTVEGNTNDAGSSNGFEVCQRVRSLDKKDFIRLPVT